MFTFRHPLFDQGNHRNAHLGRQHLQPTIGVKSDTDRSVMWFIVRHSVILLPFALIVKLFRLFETI